MRSKASRWATRKAVVVSAALVLMTVTAAAVALTVKTNGGPVTAVYSATNDIGGEATSTAFVDVPGMSTTVTVPTRERASLLITFSANVLCLRKLNGPLADCEVRVLVGGVNSRPGPVTFDSVQDGDPEHSGFKGVSGESHSMQFVAGPLGAGQYVVKVQYRVDTTGATFEVPRSTLSVLRFNAA